MLLSTKHFTGDYVLTGLKNKCLCQGIKLKKMDQYRIRSRTILTEGLARGAAFGVGLFCFKSFYCLLVRH